ncbi:hypothetical protein F4678DRAFT_414816, partial [Xylaria arbuscula]
MEDTAKPQTRWVHWMKTSISTVKPLLYLIVCYFFINNKSTYDMPWLFRVNFWLVYFAIVFIITDVIPNLIFRPPWYNEELPDEHSHILDPQYNMARKQVAEQARIKGQAVQLRDDLRDMRFFLACSS